jgi:hypothetical protein
MSKDTDKQIKDYKTSELRINRVVKRIDNLINKELSHWPTGSEVMIIPYPSEDYQGIKGKYIGVKLILDPSVSEELQAAIFCPEQNDGQAVAHERLQPHQSQ